MVIKMVYGNTGMKMERKKKKGIISIFHMKTSWRRMVNESIGIKIEKKLNRKPTLMGRRLVWTYLRMEKL